MLDSMRSLAAILGFALLPAALAQNPVDASGILRRVSEKYTSAKSFELAMTIRVTTRRERDGEIAREKTFSLHAAFADPDKYVMEWSGLDEPNVGSDGQHAWQNWPSRNEYWTGAPVRDDAALEAVRGTLEQFRYSESMTAKLLREERIVTALCYVLEVHDVTTAPAGDLVWIDKDELVILRQENSLTSGGMIEVTRADYSKVKIGEPLPDSLFEFTPPAGTTRVGRLKP
jgi:outer membrane lipoprotein-sorting protein